MKAIRSTVALWLILLTGCGDSLPPSSKPSSPTPADYLDTLATAEKRASKTVDTTTVNKAVEAFYVQEGHYPKDLLELVEMKFLRAIPKLPANESWRYDTNTGVVTIQKFAQ